MSTQERRLERFKARLREEQSQVPGTTPPASATCQKEKLVHATQDPISRYFKLVAMVGAILAGLIVAAIRGFFF